MITTPLLTKYDILQKLYCKDGDPVYSWWFADEHGMQHQVSYMVKPQSYTYSLFIKKDSYSSCSIVPNRKICTLVRYATSLLTMGRPEPLSISISL